MSDPYELTRATVKMLSDALEGGADLAPRDFELIQLLADVDALLAHIRAFEDRWTGGEVSNEMIDTYDALPKHLRRAADEQS